jgi:O-antigen ligase
MIALAALVFLFFTLAKTSLILLPFVPVVSHIAERARHLGVKMVVCLGPLLVLASVIVIAYYSAATNDVLNAVLPDTSFTGRTDVWRFAIDDAMERPSPVTGSWRSGGHVTSSRLKWPTSGPISRLIATTVIWTSP